MLTPVIVTCTYSNVINPKEKPNICPHASKWTNGDKCRYVIFAEFTRGARVS